MNITQISAQELRHAAAIAEQIESLKKNLVHILEGGETQTPTDSPAKGRRKMSAVARARIAAGARARWAKIKGTKPALQNEKPKRKLSPASRAAIAAGARARWAKHRAARKGEKTAAPQK